MNFKRKFAYYSIIFCISLCTILSSVVAKPSIKFPLTESLPSFTTLTQEYVEQKNVNQMKTYSGARQRNDSLIMIYYHDDTVAVVELGPEKLLLGCELIEIYTKEGGKKLLGELSQINRPLEIKFDEMLNLMNQCDIVDKQNRKRNDSRTVPNEERQDSSFLKRQIKNNPFSVFSGIIPGTKWCGTGDIAATYSDLGVELKMDSCCRAHDLCPTKIRAYETKFNITNDSLYTKSHCICDDMFFECLKKLDNLPGARLMGTIYFNVVQIPCIHETPDGVKFRKPRAGF